MSDHELFERSLSLRLDEAAGQMPIDPDALASVRSRAGRQRRWRLTAVVAGAAAAVIAVGAVVSFGGSDPTSLEVAGPAGTAAEDYAQPAGPRAGSGDSTLVTYSYPNAGRPPGAQDGLHHGCVLFDGTNGYWSGPGSSELGALSPSSPTPITAALASIDATQSEPADVAIAEFVQIWAGVPIERLNGGVGFSSDADLSGDITGQFVQVLWSGMATPEQTALVRRLIEALPGATVSDHADGTVRVEAPYVWFEYDPTTATPIAQGSGSPESEMRVDTITRVNAADVLVPGRGALGPPTTVGPNSTLPPAG